VARLKATDFPDFEPQRQMDEVEERV